MLLKEDRSQFLVELVKHDITQVCLPMITLEKPNKRRGVWGDHQGPRPHDPVYP